MWRRSDVSWSEPSSEAPEICVEVLSGLNIAREIDEKRALYFAAGALEFWTCDANGSMRFFTADAELSASVLVPGFPRHVSD